MISSRRLVASIVLLLSQLAHSQHPPGKQSKSPAAPKAPAPGAVVDGVYKNPWFGFSFRIPPGWVERTEQMRDDTTDPSKARVLLAVFERPPEASSEGVNSTVIVMAESASSYPDLKTAADYFGPLTEVVTAKGFKVANEPYEFAIGAHKLARSDFRKERQSSAVYQSSLVEIAKGSIISFTFIGEPADEVDGLIEQLSFATASPAKGFKPKLEVNISASPKN